LSNKKIKPGEITYLWHLYNRIFLDGIRRWDLLKIESDGANDLFYQG
jgi:hypothetical protein